MQRYAYRVTNSTELPPCLPAVPQVLCAANPATPWVAPPPRLRRDRCLASHQWVGNNGDHPPPKKKNDQNMIQQGWNVKMTVNENKISTYHTYHTYTIMKTYLKHLKKNDLKSTNYPPTRCPLSCVHLLLHSDDLSPPRSLRELERPNQHHVDQLRNDLRW
jgi:hypothetical protein